jgi:hypothetical protein
MSCGLNWTLFSDTLQIYSPQIKRPLETFIRDALAVLAEDANPRHPHCSTFNVPNDHHWGLFNS